MRTLPLGNTGEQVSALCLGAMYFGTRQDEALSFALLDQYVEAGGTFIDTANIYAHWAAGGQGGESEALLGRWMRARGNRDQLFIATKVGFAYQDVPRGLSPQLVEDECNKSLERLGIDTIDLYYAHCDDRTTPIRESLVALDKLVQAGKVRYIGGSNYAAWRLERAHAVSKADGLASFCCLQQRYTYLRPKPGTAFDPQLAVNDDMLDYVASRADDFTLLAYSVLLSGSYTRDDRPIQEQYAGPDSDARLAVLRAVADEHGVSPNQVILAWMLHSDPPVIPLIAASSHAQMAENLAALDLTLTPEHMQRLNAARA
ncbi:MAG: aldo/keto reductase [Chloroflexi bacterium]|nr:aldo/keto reductase [Chloroflexota bacterium]